MTSTALIGIDQLLLLREFTPLLYCSGIGNIQCVTSYVTSDDDIDSIYNGYDLLVIGILMLYLTPSVLFIVVVDLSSLCLPLSTFVFVVLLNVVL